MRGNQTDTEPADVEVQQDDGDGQLESGKVSLRVWVEEANIENLQKMIDSFEQKYAGQADFDITIEVSSDADTRNNVLGDIHNAADIFSMPDDQLYSLIAGGALSPVENQSEVKAANLSEAVDAASYNGTLYAYPYSADNGYFLYYNKAYLSEADVQTMDRILEVAAENEKKLSMEFNSGWYLYSFYGNTGMEFGINDDGVTNYCNWNTTEGSIKGVEGPQAVTDLSISRRIRGLSHSRTAVLLRAYRMTAASRASAACGMRLRCRRHGGIIMRPASFRHTPATGSRYRCPLLSGTRCLA